MTIHKFFSTSLLAGLLVLALAVAGLANNTPTNRVQAGVDELIAILTTPEASDPALHDLVIKQLRAVADKYIDFREVTKMSIGRPWLDMSDQMQNDLVEAFVQLLERTYLKKLPVYENQQINYKKELVENTRAKVLTEIVTADKKLNVEFRLKLIDGQWMIYDVIGEGVSLVKNYRTQFNQILQDGTPDDLLQRIRDRVQELDAASSGDNS